MPKESIRAALSADVLEIDFMRASVIP